MTALARGIGPVAELERLDEELNRATGSPDTTFDLHFRAAQIALQLDDPQALEIANKHLQDCWALRPGDIDTFSALIVGLERAGEDKAIADLLFESAGHVDRPRERAERLLRAAARYAASGDVHGAQGARRLAAQIESTGALRRKAARALIEGLAADAPVDQRLEALELLLPCLEADEAHACAMEIAILLRDDNRREESIEAFRRALALEPGDDRALEALRSELRQRGDFELLGEILEACARTSSVASTRASLWRELAKLAEDELDDTKRAAFAWWRSWETSGPAKEAATQLKRLYAAAEAWSDYNRVLQREAASAESATAKLDVYRELATFQREVLADEDAAAQTFGLILQLDPSDRAAAHARAAFFESQGEIDAAVRELLRGARRARSASEREPSYRRAARLEFERRAHHRALRLLRHLDGPSEENGALAAELFCTACDESDRGVERDVRYDLGLLALSLSPSTNALAQRGLTLGQELEVAGDISRAAEIYRRLSSSEEVGEVAKTALAALQRPTSDGDAAEALALRARNLGDSQPIEAFRLLLRAAQVLVHGDEAQRDADRIRAYIEAAIARLRPLPSSELPLLETALREATMHWELADLLADAAEREAEIPLRRELLFTLADLLKEELGDAQRAVGVLEQAYDLDRHDLALAQEIRSLHLSLENHGAQAQILERILATTSGEARFALLDELGQLYADKLDDPAAATRHYDELVGHLPAHPGALAFLRRRYEAAEDYRAVALLLSRASESKGDVLERAELHREIATIAEEQLKDLDFAVAQWWMVVELLPADTAPRAELKRLLASAGRWRDVEGVLLSEVSRSIPEEKIPVYLELSQLAADLLDDAKAATTYLRSALQLSPEHLEVMRRLATIYETSGQWRELATILRRQADAETDETETLRLLHRTARVLLGRLEREEEALAICRRARELKPGDRVSATLMAEIYSRRRRWQRLTSLLCEQIALESDPLELGRLHMEVGRTLLERLKEPEAAAQHFELALELDAGHGEVMGLLRQLYSTMGRWDLLIDLIRRRATADELSTADRAAALCEIGRIREEHQDDLEGAWEAYENAAHLAPDHRPALIALRGLAVAQQKWRDAVTVARRELDLITDPPERARLLVEIGEILHQQLNRPSAATEALEDALKADANNTDAARRLATLTFDSGDWERAGAFLEQVVNSGIELENLHDYFYRLAFANERLGNDEKAFGYYVKSFGREPMYLPTLNRLVDLCYKRRQWDNVQRIAEAIVETYAHEKSTEELAELYVRLGLAELHIAQHAVAVSKLQQIALGHGSVPTTDLTAWREVAEHWAATPLDEHLLPEVEPEVVTRAIKAMEQALNRVADHAGALQTLAALTACRGDWQRCLRFIERAVDSKATDRKTKGALLLGAGEMALRRLRDVDRAEALLKRAQSVLPGSSQIRRRLKQLDKLRSGQRPRVHTGPSRVPAPKSRRPARPPAMPPLPDDDD